MLEILGGSERARPAGLPRPARIVEIQVENYRTATLVLDLHLAAEPGQFVMAWLPGLDEKPFSLAAAAPVTLTVSRVGPFSEALHCLRPGDPLGSAAPSGTASTRCSLRAAATPLLAGGGYGVAPLGFLAEKLLAAGTARADLTVVIGARTAADLLLGRFRSPGHRAPASPRKTPPPAPPAASRR